MIINFRRFPKAYDKGTGANLEFVPSARASQHDSNGEKEAELAVEFHFARCRPIPVHFFLLRHPHLQHVLLEHVAVLGETRLLPHWPGQVRRDERRSRPESVDSAVAKGVPVELVRLSMQVHGPLSMERYREVVYNSTPSYHIMSN